MGHPTVKEYLTVEEANAKGDRMKVTVIYRGEIEMETNAPDQESAEDTVLDEIESWPDALFMERLELTIEDIKFG